MHEAVALFTCNRTELYLVTDDALEAENTALAILSRQAELRPTELIGSLYSLRGREAVEHLFSVTAGLDSMIVGEAEIQGQVKRAYEMALVEGVSGPVSNRLFRDALAAGKRVRTETGVARSNVSISTVAVQLASDFLGDLTDRRVLVIGAGENAELTARALRDRGVQTLFVANRRYDRALGLAQRFGGQARDLRGHAARAGVRRHRRHLHRRAAPDRRARGAGVRRGVAHGPPARADRPGGAARHRAERARLPRHRALRHGRPAARRGAQPRRPRGGGRGGGWCSCARRSSASRSGSRASTWCRRSRRCAGAPTRSCARCSTRTSRAGSRSRPPTASASRCWRARSYRGCSTSRRSASRTAARYHYLHTLRELFGLDPEPAEAAPAAEVTSLDSPPPTGVDHVKLGTRGSALALAQARWVAERLEGEAELVTITTGGDRGSTADKSRFVKEIEEALLAGEIDLAVHSAKDVPGELPAGLSIVGVPERADPLDALCGAASLGRPARRRRGGDRERATPRRAARAAPRPRGARAARQRRHAAAQARRR